MNQSTMLVLYENAEVLFTQVMLDETRYRQLTELVSFPSNQHPFGETPSDYEVRYIPQRPDWAVSALHFDGLQSVYPYVPQAPNIDWSPTGFCYVPGRRRGWVPAAARLRHDAGMTSRGGTRQHSHPVIPASVRSTASP